MRTVPRHGHSGSQCRFCEHDNNPGVQPGTVPGTRETPSGRTVPARIPLTVRRARLKDTAAALAHRIGVSRRVLRGTQEETAMVLGIPRASVSAMEHGTRQVSGTELVVLLAYYGALGDRKAAAAHRALKAWIGTRPGQEGEAGAVGG